MWRQPHPRFRGYTEQIIGELSDGGRWILADAGSHFMGRQMPMPIAVDSLEMASLLFRRFGINQADALAKHLQNAMRYHTFENGDRVRIEQLAHFSPEDGGVLTIDCGAGNALRLDGGDVQAVNIADTGILFSQPLFHEPWTYIPDHGSPLGRLIEGFSFVEGEDTPLSPAEQRQLFYIWLASLSFRTEMRVKPLAMATGDSWSGKSTLFRIVGRLLIGSNFDLASMSEEKEDDFWTNVTNNAIAGYDNVDGRVRWLPDALCTAADGVTRPKRVLHTTNELAVYKPDCFLMLTARTPRFRRLDVANRSLIFQMAPRAAQGKRMVAESRLYSQLHRSRDRMLSELVDVCNAALRVPEQSADDSPIRSADFYAQAMRIALGLGVAGQLQRTFEKLRIVQHGFTTEGHPIAEAVPIWLDGAGPEGILNAGRQIYSDELFRELRAVAGKNDINWPYSGASTFGRAFGEILDAVAVHFQILQRDRKGGKGTLYRLAPLDWVDPMMGSSA